MRWAITLQCFIHSDIFLMQTDIWSPYSIFSLFYNLYLVKLERNEFFEHIPLKFPRFEILALKRFPNTNKYKDLLNLKNYCEQRYCCTIFKLKWIKRHVTSYPVLNFREKRKIENKGDNSKCSTFAKKHPAFSAFLGCMLYISIIKSDGTRWCGVRYRPYSAGYRTNSGHAVNN